jgi:nondiscriminating glutamyl-tRNA synthetase
VIDMSQLDQHTKTRFCPSPTGLLHLGNLRTALFSALLGRSAQGEFLLRIEDTDQERSEARFSEQLQQDLLWLGLDWQEGPEHDLGRGPYFQSQRGFIYADYYQRLETMGAVYPCFCTEEELALARKIQRASGKPPRYPGTCQNLTQQQIDAKLQEGRRPTLRFRVPLHEEIRFTDLVRGEQCFKSADLGDFIVRRADGTAPFLFCNAVDDALMEVTHVLRGEDHVANTPRQILILKALGLPIPEYGHISLILALDGRPLSKRNGSRSLVELRNEGYLPQAIVNYLARLGHYYGHDQLLSLAELAAQFKLTALSTSPAKYNPDQLLFWQKQAIERLSHDELWNWLGQELFASLPQGQQTAFLEMIKPNLLFPADANRWALIVFGEEIAGYDIKDAADPIYFTEALRAFDQHGAQAQKILEHLKTQLQLKGKTLFQPLRLALTGEVHGPELGKLMALITPEKIHQRLLKAKQRAENL